MSILNVNTIQPIGSGTTVTVAATELKTSNFITVGTGASVTSPSANVLTLGTNTAERLRITSAGSIGIGTDNPGTKLDVRGGNWSNGDIVVGQSGNAGRVKFRRGADGSDSAFIGFAAADNNNRLSIGVDSGDGTIAFQTNSAERLRIDSSGDVGIGTDNPANVLDVQGSTHTKIHVGTTGTGHATGIQINHAKGNAALQEWQLQTDGSADGNLKIRNATSSTDVMFFDADNNNIGINKTPTTYQFEVNGGTANTVASFESTDATSRILFKDNSGEAMVGAVGDALTFYTSTNANERLRIDSSGNIGVNKTPETDWNSSYRAIEIGNSSVSAYQGSSYPSIELNMNCRGTQASYGAGWKYILGMRATQIHMPYSGETLFRRATSGSADGAISWNESMRISNDGSITKPNQPLAVIGTTQNNPTPSAGSIVQFDYAATNRGNHYNTSNYTFTCPVAGDYMVIFRHSRKGWCGDLDLQKNGTTHALLELRETGLNGASPPVPDWQAGSYSFIVPCAANDVLRWRVGAVYTSTGSGGYLLDGHSHIKYDAVTYYLIG